jgi:hypothetical protein
MPEDVADVHLVARQLDGAEDLGEELAGFSDEWPPLLILVGIRWFADTQDVRLLVPLARHRMLRALVQRARRARRDVRRELVERRNGRHIGGDFGEPQAPRLESGRNSQGLEPRWQHARGAHRHRLANGGGR